MCTRKYAGGALVGIVLIAGTIADAGPHVEYDAGPFNAIRARPTMQNSASYSPSLNCSYSLLK